MGAGKVYPGGTRFPFFPHPPNPNERRKIKKKVGIFRDMKDGLISPRWVAKASAWSFR